MHPPPFSVGNHRAKQSGGNCRCQPCSPVVMGAGFQPLASWLLVKPKETSKWATTPLCPFLNIHCWLFSWWQSHLSFIWMRTLRVFAEKHFWQFYRAFSTRMTRRPTSILSFLNRTCWISLTADYVRIALHWYDGGSTQRCKELVVVKPSALLWVEVLGWTHRHWNLLNMQLACNPLFVKISFRCSTYHLNVCYQISSRS